MVAAPLPLLLECAAYLVQRETTKVYSMRMLGRQGKMRVRLRIKPVFAWYDLWVGAYWDRNARRLYVFPLPCFGLVIETKPSPQPEAER